MGHDAQQSATVTCGQGQCPDLIRIGRMVGEMVSVEFEQIIPVAISVYRVSPIVAGFAAHTGHVRMKSVFIGLREMLRTGNVVNDSPCTSDRATDRSSSENHTSVSCVMWRIFGPRPP